jgi:hypothetical protein
VAWQAKGCLEDNKAKESAMPNQEQSRDGIPRKDSDRPSPDVERNATDGQASARGTGDSPGVGQRTDRPIAGDEKGMPLTSESPSGQDYRGDGPGKVHPRGKVTGEGRTWDEKFPSDAGKLGAPGAGLSDRNGPSDPDAKRDR